LAQRSVASKGYLEAITWSFTDDKINNNFRENNKEVKIINPISSDLNVLRSSLYPNLIHFLKKNIDRGFENQSLFEIGPSFIGKKPGQQITVICGIKKEDLTDIYVIKKDVVQTLVELGIDKNETSIDINTPSYYHPGRSGSIITKNDKKLLAYFGEIHPKIIDNTYGFEIFLENLVKYKSQNKKDKPTITFSDYQKSDRDFAFVVQKNFKAQELIEIISNVDNSLIKNVKIFDVYEGENIPLDKKSIALKVTIQSDFKTLNEKDLNEVSQKIISNVEEKASAKLRS
jgi:phenylalanyl-tRNA synthetase beta chain